MKAKHTISLLACLVLLCTVILGGCGGGSSAPAAKAPTPSSPATSAKIVEPCTLVSKTEAQQYMEQPVKDPEKKETAAVGLKLCIYNTVAEGSGKLLQIGLTQQIFMPNNGQTPKAIYTALKDNFKNAAKVAGVGDDAFIAPPGLHILKGNYYLTIAVGNSSNPKNQELLKTIGQKVVDKL